MLRVFINDGAQRTLEIHNFRCGRSFAERDGMLTIAEMTDARDSLRQAEGLAARIRGVFLSAGYIQGARVLNDVIGLLADEVAALDKAISGSKP